MMSNTWNTYKLGDISQIIGGGTPSTAIEEYWNGNIPWLTPRDLTNYYFRFISNGERNITGEGLKNSSARLLPTGTVLLTSRAPIGYVAIAQNEVSTNQGFKNFIVDETKVDNEFLYYLLINNVEYLKSLGTGTTFGEVSATTLRNVEFTFPELKTQKAIASVLASLDEKIELNFHMNQTLEKIIQQVYKEWFINLKFPDFDGKTIDGLPTGWSKIKLGELIEIKHGYAFKGEFFTETENENILLTPGNFKMGGGFNDNKLKYYNGEVPQQYILNLFDLIVTMTDLSKEGDTLGFPALVPQIPEKSLLHNQRIGKVVFKTSQKIKYYLYWILKQQEYRNFVLGSATGSTVKHTSPKRICDFVITLPDEKTLGLFEDLASGFLRKEQENFYNKQVLVATRNNLLSKLLTGKIEIQE